MTFLVHRPPGKYVKCVSGNTQTGTHIITSARNSRNCNVLYALARCLFLHSLQLVMIEGAC